MDKQDCIAEAGRVLAQALRFLNDEVTTEVAQAA